MLSSLSFNYLCSRRYCCFYSGASSIILDYVLKVFLCLNKEVCYITLLLYLSWLSKKFQLMSVSSILIKHSHCKIY